MDCVYIGTGVCAAIGFSIALALAGLTPFGVFSGIAFACSGGVIGFAVTANLCK